MTAPLPGFNNSGSKKDAAALIEFVRNEQDPAKIDAALLTASNNAPFYPDDKEVTSFLLSAKLNDPALDAKLVEAAKCSTQAREAALAVNRTSNKEGAFTNFIYVDSNAPEMSKIYKVIRAPQIGFGNGAWGGLKEDDDVDVSVTVNREVFEEVIDAVKLLLKIHGGTEAANLEKGFDKYIYDATAAKKDLREGVQDFIGSIDNNETLRSRMIDLSDKAQYLITDLVAARKTKLFKCRDDAHAIERGWGFRVDAYAHYSSISEHTAHAFDDLRTTVDGLKKAAQLMGIPGVGGEMQGITAYTLKDAPEEVKRNFYGHEGLAEIIGFARLVKQYKHLQIDTLWDDFAKSGAVDMLAKKMRLQPAALKEIYDTLTGNAAPYDQHIEVSTDKYKTAQCAKAKTQPKP